MLRRAAPLVVGVATVAGAALVVAVQPGPVALAGDNLTLTHPLLVDAFRQLAGGRWPIWTGGRWGGSPLAGDPVTGVFYPPYFVGYALTPFPHWRALDVSLVLHLGVLVGGVIWLMGRLGTGVAVGIATAALFVLSPPSLGIARNLAQYWAATAYWPWLLGAADALAAGRARAPLVVFTVTLAAQTYAGYPQFALYSGAVAVGWLVLRPGCPRARRVGVAAVGSLAAVGLAAPVIVPGLAMAAGSIRGGAEGARRLNEIADVFAIPLAGWIEVVRAGPAGLPAKLASVTLLLAAVGGAQRSFAALFLVAVAVTSALLATRGVPLYRVVQLVPGFDLFGGPMKYLHLVAFATAILAGLGLARLVRAPSRVGRLAIAVLVGAALPATAAAVPGRLGWAVGTLGLSLALVPGRLLGTALVVVSIATSLAFAVATRVWTTASPFARPAIDALVLRPPPIAPADGGRLVALVDEGAVSQIGVNIGALWGIETWNGVGALVQRRQLETMERIRRDDVVPLLRQLGADPVVLVPGRTLGPVLAAAGFHPGPAVNGVRSFSAPAVAPRYELVARARPATASDAVDAARAGRGVVGGVALIEDDDAAVGEPGDADGLLHVEAARPGDVHLRVEVQRRTWLLAREPFYPNWQATVDGAPVKVRPAAGLFLAVPVEAGRHDVALVYREPGVRIGIVLAAVTAVLFAVVVRRRGAAARRSAQNGIHGAASMESLAETR